MLLRRLLYAEAALTTPALGVALLTTTGRQRATLTALVPLVALVGVAALRPRWPYPWRATIAVGVLVVAAALTYLTAGTSGNAGSIATGAVVFAVLLLGRRGFSAAVCVLVGASVGVAAGMLSGALPAPMEGAFAVTSPSAWLRVLFVSAAIWSLAGIAVGYVVRSVEEALRSTQDALARLEAAQAERDQALRARLDAERRVMRSQRTELIGRLAAGVAHDFNNLLSIVGCWTELLSAPDVGAPEREEARVAISTAVDRGAALTKQLLALTRSDPRAVRRLRLDDVVRRGLSSVRRLVPADLTVTLDAEAPVAVDADENEVQHVLLNLVVNARDAQSGAGRIHVEVAEVTLDAPREVAGGTLRPGTWVALRVRDAGTGMARETRERVFEPFFTTKAVGAGSGLGLATVWRIVADLGGGVECESVLGEGTTFTVYLPRAPGPPTETDAPDAAPLLSAPGPARAGEGLRVLVLEDEGGALRAFVRILENAGHSVVAAGDGPAALAALGAGPFHALCADAVVPGGWSARVIEVFERSFPGAGVLVISGYVEEEATRRGIAQGRYRFLRKPFSGDDLRRALAEVAGPGSGGATPRHPEVPDDP